MAKVAIILPIYNSQQFLQTCLDSIKAQTFQNFICIMINDGSTDGSDSICAEYALADNRFLLFSQSNHGIAFTRNRGIDIALTYNIKYISFIDSDDFIEPDYLNKLYNFSESNNADVVRCEFCDDNSNLKHFIPPANHKENLKLCFKNIWHSFLSDETTGLRAYLWLYLIKADLFRNNIKCLDGKNHLEDFVILTQVFAYAKSIYFLNEKLYHYRVNLASISRNIDISALYQKIDNLIFVENFLKSIAMEDDCILIQKRITITKLYLIIFLSPRQFLEHLSLNDINNLKSIKMRRKNKLFCNIFIFLQRKKLVILSHAMLRSWKILKPGRALFI